MYLIIRRRHDGNLFSSLVLSRLLKNSLCGIVFRGQLKLKYYLFFFCNVFFREQEELIQIPFSSCCCPKSQRP